MTTPLLLFVLLFFCCGANFVSSEDEDLNSELLAQIIVNTIVREPSKITPDKISALVDDPDIAAAFDKVVGKELTELDNDLAQYARILKSSTAVRHRSIKQSNELLTSAEAKVKEYEQAAAKNRKQLNILEASANTMMNLTEYLEDFDDDNESGGTSSIKSLVEGMKDRKELLQHLKAANERTQRSNQKLQEILTNYKPAILRREQLMTKIDGIVQEIEDHLESSKAAKTVEEKANKLRHTALLSRRLTERIESLTTEAKDVFREVNELKKSLSDAVEESVSGKEPERKQRRDEL